MKIRMKIRENKFLRLANENKRNKTNSDFEMKGEMMTGKCVSCDPIPFLSRIPGHDTKKQFPISLSHLHVVD